MCDLRDRCAASFLAAVLMAAPVAIEALAKEVERVLTISEIPVPAAVLEAVRASRKHEATAEGLRYKVEPIEVDAEACARVQPGMLGAVLMKMDVAVEPVP